MLTIEGVKYNLWTPKDEENEFHPLVKKNYKLIFGESSVYFDLKQKLVSRSGLIGIPDAYVIVLSEPMTWYIIENELSTHDVYEHIVGQVSKFMSLITELETQRELVKALCQEIDQDSELRAFIKKRVNTEIFRFLTELVAYQPKIALIIDNITPKLDKALSTLSRIANTEVVEFKTYVREDDKSAKAHIFEPLHSEKSYQNSIVTEPVFSSSQIFPAPNKSKNKRKFDTASKRLKFWTQLIGKSRSKTNLFSNKKPTKESSINLVTENLGLRYNIIILADSARIELFIDKGNKNQNKRLFDELFLRKEDIERRFGSTLVWERLDDARGSAVRVIVTKDKGLLNENEWFSIQDEMIDTIIRLEKAMKEPINQLERSID